MNSTQNTARAGSTATHTPGPWIEVTRQIAGSADCEPIVRPECDDDDDICRVIVPDTQRDGGRNGPVANANARLIAAAPELLEALKEIIRVEEAAIKRFAEKYGQESCDQIHPKPLVWEAQARAAIAKAEGHK
jgi:hypothetical protein